MRVSSALKAIAHLHPEVFEGTMGKKFSSLVKSLDDNNLKNSFVALEKIKDSWEYLEPDVKQKLESFVENLPKEDLDELEFLLSHSGLKSAADRRVKYATRSDLGAPAFFILPSLVGDRIVKLYAESQSFEQANSFSSVVVRHAYDYTKGQVERIIRACGNNYEIKESFEVTTVINAMRQNKSVTDEEIDEWLIDVGLKKYTKPVAVE